MARTSKTGGIYIEIGGDARPLEEVLNSVKARSENVANSVVKEFNGALSKVDTSKVMGDISGAFGRLKTNLQGVSADITQFEKDFQDMGRQIGLAQNQAKVFGETMAAAFQKRNERDVTAALRSIQRQAGLTDDAMKKLSASMGAAQFYKSTEKVTDPFSTLNIRSTSTITAEMKSIVQAYREVKTSATASAQDIQRANEAMRTSLRKLASEARVATKEAGGADQISSLRSTVAGFGKAVAGIVTLRFAAVSTVDSVNALTESMLKMSKLSVSYGTIFGGQFGATQQLDYIYEKTQSIGLQFQVTAESAKGFFAAAQGTSLQKDMNNIFDAVSNSAAALQMSGDDVQGVFRALGQMVSKGKVQAEELRGQLGERLPGAFQMAAKAMDMSTAELNKFMEDGKLTAEDLLPKLARALNDQYAEAALKAANSVQGSINRMSTEWTQFKANVLDSEAVVGMLNTITAALKGRNEAERQDKERDSLVSQLKGMGIGPDSEGVTYDFQGQAQKTKWYSDELLNWQRNLNALEAAQAKSAKEAADEQESILAKSSNTIKTYLKNDKESRLAAAKEEYDIAMQASADLEQVYRDQGVNIEGLLQERARISAEYQKKVNDINNKGSSGAKSLANKQFKFDTGLDQLRQEVANMESTINPAAVGIDKLRQKLELEKQNAIAAAEAHAKLSIQRKEATPDEAAEKESLEIRKAELTYTQKLADAEEKGRQVRVDFYKDFAELSGNYVESINAQTEAVKKQVEEYRNAGISDELVKQWEELTNLKNARDPFSGLARGLRKYANEASNFAEQFESLTTSAFGNVEDAFTDMLVNGQLSFTNFANAIIEDLARIAIRASITGPIASGLSGLFSSGSSGFGSLFGSTTSSVVVTSSEVFHSGGVVGSTYAPSRAVPTSVFSGAPKFHSGGGIFGPDEYPAILQKGEVVIPKSLVSGSGGGSSSSSSQPQVFVNIQNNTGSEVSQRTRTDNMGNKSIEVIIGEASAKQTMRPGTAMNRAVRSATGTRSRTIQH